MWYKVIKRCINLEKGTKVLESALLIHISIVGGLRTEED